MSQICSRPGHTNTTTRNRKANHDSIAREKVSFGYNRPRTHVSRTNRIRIAVGSTRRPKIGAVSEALAEFGSVLGAVNEFEVIGVEVESGVGHTPATREELMRGARQRADALMRIARDKAESWDYLVGM